MGETPSQIAWRASGSHVVAGCAPCSGRCWLCGGNVGRGMQVDDWLPDTFTAHSRAAVPSSPVVCEACVFVCSRVSPVPGREAKEGKKLGGNFRNFSHLWDELGYSNASKGEKPTIREFLARRHAAPWFAAIADSGQKHVLPWAPMNGPGRAGRVLFDEQAIAVPDDQGLVEEMAALLTAGATKDEMVSGDYRAQTYERCAVAVAAFERAHSSERRGGWFTLALWLAQRDEDAVERRQAAEKEAKDAKRKAGRKAPNADRGDAPSRARGVPRGLKPEHAEALGDPVEPGEGGGPHDRDAGAVDHGAVPRDADPVTQQLDMFGCR